MTNDAKAFIGNVANVYERLVVPMFMEPYAEDLAGRIAAAQPRSVLELACGTGVVTRKLAKACRAKIVATDLNADMLEQAEATGTARPVEWREADALALPFPDTYFDTVVCQFGVMFFPDKVRAFAEARRVLAPGGTLIFNAWDTLEDNEFFHVVHVAVGEVFPDDPPGFLARTPYAYNDRAEIGRQLSDGGFASTPDFETVTKRSNASSPEEVAITIVDGTPLSGELGPGRVDDAKIAAARAIEARFGPRDLDGKMQAVVVSVRR